jgi:hypothetical protein
LTSRPETELWPVSLCPNSLAHILNDATGIRSAIVKRWIMMGGKAGEKRRWRLEELERKAREDLERVAKLDEGNGRGL